MMIGPNPVASLPGAFLIALPALISIVNPIGSALIFHQSTEGRTAADLRLLARKIALNAFILLLASIWAGGYVLAFFGITLPALRIAGGLVVAISGWKLLAQPEEHEERRSSETVRACVGVDEVAFFPLTMPLTTGPGSIAVAIALGSQLPPGAPLLPFFLGLSLAALVVAATVWISYRYADRMLLLLGAGGVRIVSRLVAFLLLCVGVQILGAGVQAMLRAAFLQR